jgi:hypothetical protein
MFCYNVELYGAKENGSFYFILVQSTHSNLVAC